VVKIKHVILGVPYWVIYDPKMCLYVGDIRHLTNRFCKVTHYPATWATSKYSVMRVTGVC